MNIQSTPFAPFIDRMNKDLYAWTNKKNLLEELLTDYKKTLAYVQENQQYNDDEEILVDLGDGVLSECRRTTNTILIRMKEDLYVEMKQKQAEKVLKQLITLYKEKIGAAEKQMLKINVSMREVEDLIHQYTSLA